MMNFLIGIIIALIPASLIAVGINFVPKKFIALIPDPFASYYKETGYVLALLVFLWVFSTNMSAYGPRLEVTPAPHVAVPSKVEATKGEDWSNTKDRRGNADELLKEVPMRAPIEDAKEDDDESNPDRS